MKVRKKERTESDAIGLPCKDFHSPSKQGKCTLTKGKGRR